MLKNMNVYTLFRQFCLSHSLLNQVSESTTSLFVTLLVPCLGRLFQLLEILGPYLGHTFLTLYNEDLMLVCHFWHTVGGPSLCRKNVFLIGPHIGFCTFHKLQHRLQIIEKTRVHTCCLTRHWAHAPLQVWNRIYVLLFIFRERNLTRAL